MGTYGQEGEKVVAASEQDEGTKREARRIVRHNVRWGSRYQPTSPEDMSVWAPPVREPGRVRMYKVRQKGQSK